MLHITEKVNLNDIFSFHLSFQTPYFFDVSFEDWKKSFEKDIVGKGIGTNCMSALKQFLYNKGITRFDTDTALNNTVAQHYYEKTNFTREGVTRSYYHKCNMN